MGGLLAYGPDLPRLFLQAGALTPAGALGVTVATSVLLLADAEPRIAWVTFDGGHILAAQDGAFIRAGPEAKDQINIGVSQTALPNSSFGVLSQANSAHHAWRSA